MGERPAASPFQKPPGATVKINFAVVRITPNGVQRRRWNLNSRPLPYDKAEADEESEYFNASNAVDKLPLNVINNYFSLGADAATALEFHESRGKTLHPIRPF
ncbi:unnamed protein product [Dibothriocephalus latus]|uniref:Diacylglycerol kinase accessory domain-containing protein n=1 Tax=Dibothriocephalus latus TaxID=60516 RepID=A0A3P7LPS1_DIBLA|nr:unnamed protein product [Dibothriocephalus latus]